MLDKILENVRKKKPIIHCIINYVTAKDCANVLLACGSKPIMADEFEEVSEIVSLSNGLLINIGTLNKHTASSMVIAGKRANELGIPVILDPVGIGVSRFRFDTVMNLLKKIHFTVIKGNISEIKIIAGKAGDNLKSCGVDAIEEITNSTLKQVIAMVKDCANKLQSVFVLTGAVDIVTDGNMVYCVHNGNKTMAQVTGTGCQLASIIAAFVSANLENPLVASLAATCAMGICGEVAKEEMTIFDGNASYGNHIIDAMYNLIPQNLENGAKYEMR